MQPTLSNQKPFLFSLFKHFFLLLLLSLPIFAEQLPLKIYSSADGLANDAINRMFSDSRGFLWICTNEGLSRFDGFRFKNFTQEQGLPHRNINSFLETKDGDYLVATSGGLAVFNPVGKAFRWNIIEGKLEQNSNEPPMFKTYLTPEAENNSKISKSVMSLAADSNGIVYAGTNNGLFKFIKSGQDWRFEKVEFEDWKKEGIVFNFLLTDSKKNLWIATNIAIYLVGNDGKISKINESGGNSVFEDQSGNVWVDSGGNPIGIRFYSYQNGNSIPTLIRTYTTKDGLRLNGFSNAIAKTVDGKIFVNSGGKLHEFLPNATENEPKFRPLETETYTSATDKSGNLWFSTIGKGFARYLPNSFRTFAEKDGMPKEGISTIFGNRNGEVFLTIGKDKLARVNEGKIETLQPFGLTLRDWIDTLLDFQSQDGEFWVPSVKGLLRYPKIEKFADLARTPPKKVYTTADGLFSDNISALFEDSRGDVWIGAPTADNSLIRWEKSTDKIHRYTFEQGFPRNSGAISFGEDAAGNIWIGFYFGQIFRLKDGKFRDLTEEGLIPRNSITKILSDKKGRLWISTTSRGLFRIDEPNAENPVFTNLSIANGLSSNLAYCLAEDKFGRIYVGTGRGINRLDTETGRIKIFTQNDGLPSSLISKCYADTNGTLWFSFTNNLIKFVPEIEKASAPPPIFIDAISVNGKPRAISELGEREIKNLALESDERQIQIGFFAISFDSGETLRYQYKINDQDWSEASERRTVDFNLSPGTYNFAVRAITANGVLSDSLASVSFTIAPPIWQRWWFITFAILAIGAAVFALDRYRVRKTHQVEKALDETKRANVLIRESEIRFRTLADTASDAILTIDADSKIIFVNEAIEKVFGYSAEELIGKPMTMLMPERMRSGHDQGLTRYLQTNQKNINWEGVTLPGLHKNGHEIPLEVSFGEFEREGKRYFTGIARDVSEKKRAEEALQRAREEKFKELQKVRTRIATDLHDDIGSSLTQISLYSELARQKERENGKVGEQLDVITNVANELVETMSDIVWAINPKKDHLQDLTQRMRRFAANILTAKDIDMEFQAPDSDNEIPLGANIRREVFLIFKETVNNIAKHSEATEAIIKFSLRNDFFIISFEDNGRGFDQTEKLNENGHQDWKKFRGGNGLNNMRKRAQELGGEYEIKSEIGKGTIVILSVPLQQDEMLHKTFA
ncbi:MAG: two-component regulator propeller domain-containing protein [Acidobacteriota bacterium]